MRDNLNDDEKEKVRKCDNKSKKEKCGDLDNDGKEQLKKYDIKTKKKNVVTLIMMGKNN